MGKKKLRDCLSGSSTPALGGVTVSGQHQNCSHSVAHNKTINQGNAISSSEITKKKKNECNRRWSHMFPHWSTSCNLNSGPLPRSPAFINSLNLDWAHVSLTMNLYIQYRIYLVGIDFKKMGCDKLPLVDVHSPSGGSGGGGLAQSPNCLFAKREIIPD